MLGTKKVKAKGSPQQLNRVARLCSSKTKVHQSNHLAVFNFSLVARAAFGLAGDVGWFPTDIEDVRMGHNRSPPPWLLQIAKEDLPPTDDLAGNGMRGKVPLAYLPAAILLISQAFERS